jgi:hypothetical protein
MIVGTTGDVADEDDEQALVGSADQSCCRVKGAAALSGVSRAGLLLETVLGWGQGARQQGDRSGVEVDKRGLRRDQQSIPALTRR